MALTNLWDKTKIWSHVWRRANREGREEKEKREKKRERKRKKMEESGSSKKACMVNILSPKLGF